MRVHRGNWQKVKAPCIQSLVLTMRQATSHWQCYYLVQETIVIWVNALHTWRNGGRGGGRVGAIGGVSVWVMPSVHVYENFLKRSQAVAGGHPKQFQEYVHDHYVHKETHTTSIQDLERKQHEFVKHHFVSKEVHAESVQGFQNFCKASVQHVESSMPHLISAHVQNNTSLLESLLLPVLNREREHICKLFESKFLSLNERIDQLGESMPSNLQEYLHNAQTEAVGSARGEAVVVCSSLQKQIEQLTTQGQARFATMHGFSSRRRSKIE